MYNNIYNVFVLGLPLSQPHPTKERLAKTLNTDQPPPSSTSSRPHSLGCVRLLAFALYSSYKATRPTPFDRRTTRCTDGEDEATRVDTGSVTALTQVDRALAAAQPLRQRRDCE